MNSNALLQRYQNLDEGDQKALRWLALFVALVVLVYVILLPSVNYYKTAKSGFSEQSELLIWVQANAPQVKAHQSSIQPRKADKPVMEAVTSTASRLGIEVNRLQPEGKKLRAWLSNVAFGASIKWLTELTQKHAIEVEQISVEKTAKPGVVNIQCLLGTIN